MSMNPDPQGQQRPGLFARIGNFFGEGDPNAGTPTDPFANLSRAQRTMLGFAALRDAAASLEGRDSNYFSQALGGFEQAQERERLRAQGIFQNQVGALQALAQIEQQIALAQSYGMPVSPAMTQMRDMLMGSLGQGGVMPAGGAAQPVQTPGDFTGGVVPQGFPGGPQGVTGAPPTGVVYDDAGTVQPQTYTGEQEVVPPAPAPAPPPAPAPAPSDPLAELNAERDALMRQMQLRLAAGGETRDIEFLLDENRLAREALGEAAQEAQQRQATAETGTPQVVSTLGTVEELRAAIEDEPRTTTGFWGRILGNVPGSAAYDARALADTIGANLAFDQLAAMRAASPTGGALGNVTERELDMLQSSIANLDLAQSTDQVLNNLETIETRYQRLIRRAYETSEDPAALDAALGGRPAFLAETRSPQTGGATHRYNPATGQIEAIR